MKDSIINLKKAALQLKSAKVSYEMNDHSTDPFFVKKLAEAKKRLKNVVLPAELKGKK
jgi:hypothetical protein